MPAQRPLQKLRIISARWKRSKLNRGQVGPFSLEKIMLEKEYRYRQELIDHIEGQVGLYEAIWNEWPTEQLEKLWRYISNQP